MARTARPIVEKLKDMTLDLEPEEFVEFGEWLERVIEVREADKKAAERRAQRVAATKQEGAAQ